MGAGKGGKSTTKVEIPENLELASEDALNLAAALQAIPATPYKGPDIAEFTGQQKASMRGANQLAKAFGMPTAKLDLPPNKVKTSMGGLTGYSAAPAYEKAKDASIAPKLQKSIDDLFLDPTTGKRADPFSAAYEDKYGGTREKKRKAEKKKQNAKKNKNKDTGRDLEFYNTGMGVR